MKASESKRRPAQSYTPEEVEAMLRCFSRRSSCALRDKAVILVLYRGMLRISEALCLEVRDLDTKAGTAHVRHGKGDKSRVVGLPTDTLDAIDLWMREREARGVQPGGYLFPTLQGAKLCTSHFRHLLPRLARKAGLAKRAHAHGFRHSGAVRMLRAGKNVRIISKALGHSNLATTQTYLDHFSPDEVIRAMKDS